MKPVLLSLFVFSFSLWGAEPKVVSIYKLQKRGKAGSQLTYIPNQDTPFTGKAVAFHPNGQKRWEQTYKDGKLDGLWTGWWKNGQKRFERNYKDGKRDGLTTEWYENGQKGQEVKHKDGKLMSTVHWKPNGEKCPVTNVKDGDGIAVWYKDDGTEWVRQTYKDGKLVRD
tara:strand:- start:39 stop:545 length:507 start_codon:yes stop_codon:yes gene_type:complete